MFVATQTEFNEMKQELMKLKSKEKELKKLRREYEELEKEAGIYYEFKRSPLLSTLGVFSPI